MVARLVKLRPVLRARMQAAIPDELHAELGAVTAHQLEALTRLGEEGLTMRELADALEVSGPAACTLADRLVSRELAERRAGGADRRVVWLAPTARGRALAGRYDQAQHQAIAALIEGLSDDEVATWLDLMERVAGERPTKQARSTSSPQEVLQ